MESLVKCAGCGKKPRIKANATRRGWGAEVRSPQGTSKTVLRPPKRGLDAQAYWAYKHAQQAAEEDGSFSWGQSGAAHCPCDQVRVALLWPLLSLTWNASHSLHATPVPAPI